MAHNDQKMAVENGRKWAENYRKLPKITDNRQKMTEMAGNVPKLDRKWRQMTENVPKMAETGRKFAVNRPKIAEKYRQWLTMTKRWSLKMVENGRKRAEKYRKIPKMAYNGQRMTEMAENGP